MSETFTIPGPPAGWRTQHSGRHVGKGKVIVTTRLADPGDGWQKAAIARLRFAYRGKPMTGPLRIRVDGVYPRPKRLDCPHVRACSCGPEMLTGEAQWFTSTPDATNVHKLAEDALVKAGVIEDDRLVCDYGGSARYAAKGEDPHVRITIGAAEPLAGKGRDD